MTVGEFADYLQVYRATHISLSSPGGILSWFRFEMSDSHKKIISKWIGQRVRAPVAY